MRDIEFRKVIRQIPKGKVATYGQVAAAAGYPGYHRYVAQMLRKSGDALPWQRVVGAGGQLRLQGEKAMDQRIRLELEGVRFRGARVNMKEHQHKWEWVTIGGQTERSPVYRMRKRSVCPLI